MGQDYLKSQGEKISTAATTAVRANGIRGALANLGTSAFNMFKSGAGAIINGIAGSLRSVGHAIVFIGRAALMNPIGLLIAGIAVGALLIFKYWEPIKAWFSGFWQGLTEGLAPLAPMFDSVFSSIGSTLGKLKPVWDWIVNTMSSAWNWVSKLFLPFKSTSEQMENATVKGRDFGTMLAAIIVTLVKLPGKFFESGVNIVTGLIDGIKSMGSLAKDAISGLGDQVTGWFKDKLGIHSPSRVFSAFGGYITEGLAIGIDKGQDQPLMQVSSMAKRLTRLGAGIAIGAAAMPAMAFDTRAPLIGSAGGPMVAYSSNDTVQIQIMPTPGMDPQAIARAVSAELDKRDREKAARVRSSLHDY